MNNDPFIPGIAELAYYDATDVVRVKLAAASHTEPKQPMAKMAVMHAEMQTSSLAGAARL